MAKLEDILPEIKACVTCPVCLGRGLVVEGFYLVYEMTDYFTTTGTATERCRSCDGKGIVWS